MVGETSKKRNWKAGYNRKHDRNKFRKTTNATVHRTDLGNGLKGFIFSCTPHHENQCFRDGVMLLSRYCEAVNEKHQKPGENKSDKSGLSLEEELKGIRSGEGKLFTRVDAGVNGSVFVKINKDDINIEEVVEAALRDAQQRGNPGSRHCIRLLPIYTSCYAKPDDAAKAAVGVVKDHFPAAADPPTTYAISFRSRLNSGAKRDDFIPAIASAIEQLEPKYKVNLTKPDVVLIVEVLKTSCCIGVFRHFYELGKMNLREAACPSKPKEDQEKKAISDKVVDSVKESSAPEKGSRDGAEACETDNDVKQDEHVQQDTGKNASLESQVKPTVVDSEKDSAIQSDDTSGEKDAQESGDKAAETVANEDVPTKDITSHEVAFAATDCEETAGDGKARSDEHNEKT